MCDAAEIFKGSRHVTHSEQWGHGPSTEPNLGLPTNTVRPMYWHEVMVKESAALIAGAKQGEHETQTQKTQSPQWLSGKVFYRQCERQGCRMLHQLMHNFQKGWHQYDASSIINFLVSTSLESLCLCWQFSSGVGLLPIKQLRSVCQAFIYIF